MKQDRTLRCHSVCGAVRATTKTVFCRDVINFKKVSRSRRDFLFNFAAALGFSTGQAPSYAEGYFSTAEVRGTPSEDGKPNEPVANDTKRTKVLPGIDVLAAEHFSKLVGLHVGLITNQTGRDTAGRRTIDLLSKAPGIKLVAIFSPEHGLNADREGTINSGNDARTGLQVHSLYGATRRPTPAMLAGIDALVIDLQDVGVRFYTYITTMAYALEEAAQRGIKFIVLDRPNPIGPAGVQGPMLDPALRSFVGYFIMPVQHGMTIGELAAMFNGENRIGANLTIVPMRNYKRTMWFDQTELSWINPSPNLRSLEQALLYPGVALLEGANVSVGRGTMGPFEYVGAPWINAEALARHLVARKISGIRLEPVSFTPSTSSFAGELCRGVRMRLTNRDEFSPPQLGIELAIALVRQYPSHFMVRAMLGNLGSAEVLARIEAKEEISAIMSQWQSGLKVFEALRTKYLLYV